MMKRSVKAAIIIPLVIALAGGIAAMALSVGYISSETTNRLTDENVASSVALCAEEFASLCDGAYGVASAIAPLIFGASSDANAGSGLLSESPREYATGVLTDALLASENLFGTWTCWEPNAFDGRDEQFIDAPGHDGSGRFVAYVTRSEGGASGVNIEALTDYDDVVAGDYYQGPLRAMKPYITDPYAYDIGGKTVLMCSIGIPVVIDGAARGVVGIDLSINDFTDMMASRSIMGDGYLFALSPGGYVSAHPTASLITNKYAQIPWTAGFAPQIDGILANGGELSGEAFAADVGESLRFTFNSVSIGNTGRHWLVAGVVPVSTVNAESSRALLIIILIGAALLVGVSLFTYVATSRKLAPLAPLTAFLQKAGDTGDLSMTQSDRDLVSKHAGGRDELSRCISGAANFTRHVTNTGAVLERIADGDLTSDVKLLSDSDTMGLSLRRTLDSLNSMFARIISASTNVHSGSNQIAGGAQSLAAGSTEQAASIEQLSAAMSEIAVRTKGNSSRALQAAQLAGEMKKDAEKGAAQMNEMVEAVKQINEASRDIGAMLKTIDDISFQSNILALNAAVEAAHAAAHGRGFAVVAEEVRNLSVRSSESARETEALLASSTDKANLGMRIANETANSLSQIVSGIAQSASLVEEIANSSEEQRVEIAQISSGIEQVAQVITHNTASAEESAAAADEMSGQAEELQRELSRFRLKNR